MLNINLEKYHSHLRLSTENSQRTVYDPVRKKYYLAQPEELVRQSWIQYLNLEKKIQFSSLGVEKQFTVLGRGRRFDLVLYRKGQPYTLFEFKSFNKKINDDTCFQAAQYNLELKVPYVVVSNGINHFAFEIEFDTSQIKTMGDLSFLDF